MENLKTRFKILFFCLIAGTWFSTPTLLTGQDSLSIDNGNFYGDVFLNANYDADLNRASARLNRLHFGYRYQYSKSIYFNGMIESAREDYQPNGDYNGITNLFEFCLGYEFDKVKGKAGLIGTELNQFQEKHWKHRYIDKVFADKYGFAPTNDFGALFIYDPVDLLSVDASVTNGEGHKSGQTDSTYRYAIGLTLSTPIGLTLRFYSDYVPDTYTDVNTIASIGYLSPKMAIGIEWNQKYNKANINNLDYGGYSAFASAHITSKIEVFARYDYVTSHYPGLYTPEPGADINGQLVIGGVQYTVNNKVIIALNNRNWIEEADNSTKSFAFLDIALNF